MAQLTIPPICPHCQKPVQPGEPHRVCGLDQRTDIPVTLVGHRDCAQANGFVIIRR